MKLLQLPKGAETLFTQPCKQRLAKNCQIPQDLRQTRPNQQQQESKSKENSGTVCLSACTAPPAPERLAATRICVFKIHLRATKLFTRHLSASGQRARPRGLCRTSLGDAVAKPHTGPVSTQNQHRTQLPSPEKQGERGSLVCACMYNI